MSLLRFEIEKLFLNRRTLLLIGVCLAISLVSGLTSVMNLRGQAGDYARLSAWILDHQGPVDPQLGEAALQEVQRLQALRISDPSAYAAEPVWALHSQYLYANATSMVQNYLYGRASENPENPYSIAGLTHYLAHHSDPQSFDYRSALKNLEMKQRAGTPGYYHNMAWEALLSFLNSGGAIFLTLILGLVVAPLFSGEVSSGMDALILSSRLGRSRIVTAKLLAGAFFTTCWVLVFYLLNTLAYFLPFGSFIGAKSPLNSIYLFHLSPYGGWSILTYTLVAMGCAWLACLTLTLATALLSTTQRSSLPVFGMILGILLLPQILETVRLRGFFRLLTEFGLMRLAQAAPLFSHYRAFNFFGGVLLYPWAVAGLLTLACLALTALTYQSYRRSALR